MTFAQRYGPWALITGASEGTGRAFAKRLAAEGVNCILVARREGPLAQTAEEIRAAGVECVTASVDLAAPDASDRIREAVGSREVGLLISNAGADMHGANFLDRKADDWAPLVDMNVGATMRNCHHFGGLMRDRGRGGIILLGSGVCYGGLSGYSVYAGVKAFALCFGEGLWAELRHHGVDVLNLILGQTDTPAYRGFLERHGQSLPQGTASPDDVAEVGLARLSQGPIYNWGQEDDVAGLAPNSPAARRARIVMIDEMTKR